MSQLCTYTFTLANQAIHPFGVCKLVSAICLGNKAYVVMEVSDEVPSVVLIINLHFRTCPSLQPIIVKVPLMWTKPLSALNKLSLGIITIIPQAIHPFGSWSYCRLSDESVRCGDVDHCVCYSVDTPEPQLNRKSSRLSERLS